MKNNTHMIYLRFEKTVAYHQMNIRFSRGSIYMIFAGLFFSIMAALVKLSGLNLPSQEIVLARSLVVFTITAFLLKRKKLPLWGNNKKLLFLRGLMGFFGLSAFYYTLTTIPIADSVMLQYTNPIFTALLAGYILKERSSAHNWLYFFIAFAGVLLIIRPGFSIHYFPATIGLLGAIFAALAYNLVRKLRESEHPLHIILYLPAVSIVLSTPIVSVNFVMPRKWDWLILLGIGVFTMIFQIFLTLGLHHEKAAKATNISYINVVFSTLWGILLFGEIPDVRTIIGAGIILFAIFKIAREEPVDDV